MSLGTFFTDQLRVYRRKDGTVSNVSARSTAATEGEVYLPRTDGIVYDGEYVILRFPAANVVFVEPS